MRKKSGLRLRSDCSNHSCLHSSPGDATPPSSPQKSNNCHRRILAWRSPSLLSSHSPREFYPLSPHIPPDKHIAKLAGSNLGGREVLLWRNRTTPFGKASRSLLPGHSLALTPTFPQISPPPSGRARNKSAPPRHSACLLSLVWAPLSLNGFPPLLCRIPCPRCTGILLATAVLLGRPSRSLGGQRMESTMIRSYTGDPELHLYTCIHDFYHRRWHPKSHTCPEPEWMDLWPIS